MALKLALESEDRSISDNPPPSSPRSYKGTYVGDYKLGKTLGEGSFGKVVSATHTLTGQTVAVKILFRERIKDADELSRVEREIRVLHQLRHPHVVHLLEVIETKSQIYLVMEYASGGELFDYIVTHGRVKEEKALKFFLQMISAVRYCHRNGVIHRDLKPENLLLDDRSNIKIIDFGFSNTFSSGKLLDTFCGSPAYAPPEMVVGEAYDGEKVDIWSMGVILFALIAGYLPFDDPNVTRLYRKVMACKYKCPRYMSDPIRDLISRMLVIEPSGRISLDDILRHPWIVDNASPDQIDEIMAQAPDQSASGPDGCPGLPRLDPDILTLCVHHGFDQDELRSQLAENERTAGTTTYSLLAARKVRAPDEIVALLEGAHSGRSPEGSIRRVQNSPSGLAGSPRRGTHHAPRVSSPLASSVAVGIRKRTSTVGATTARSRSPRALNFNSSFDSANGSEDQEPYSPSSPTSPQAPSSPNRRKPGKIPRKRRATDYDRTRSPRSPRASAAGAAEQPSAAVPMQSRKARLRSPLAAEVQESALLSSSLPSFSAASAAAMAVKQQPDRVRVSESLRKRPPPPIGESGSSASTGSLFASSTPVLDVAAGSLGKSDSALDPSLTALREKRRAASISSNPKLAKVKSSSRSRSRSGSRSSSSKSSSGRKHKIRTVRGIFSVSTTSNKPADDILAEVLRVLDASDIRYSRQAYRIDCYADSAPSATPSVSSPSGASPGVPLPSSLSTSTPSTTSVPQSVPLRFELEICRIPKMSMHGVRLKRISGDTWYYSRLCHALVAQMNL